MPAPLEQPPKRAKALAPLWKRLVWFGGLSITGALSCAVIAYALKTLLH